MLLAILGNSDAGILHRLGERLHKSVVQALYETAPQESFSGVSYKITYKSVLQEKICCKTLVAQTAPKKSTWFEHRVLQESFRFFTREFRLVLPKDITNLLCTNVCICMHINIYIYICI